MIRASVIIRAKDEQNGIGRTLSLLAAQTIAAESEVILVDSGSTDRTVAIAREAGARVLEIPAAAFTFGGALNLGASHASGQIGVALSAHAYPPDERWLERLVDVFADERVACASGDDYGFDGRPLQGRVVQDEELARRRPAWGYSNAAGGFRLSLWRKRAFRPEMPGTEDKEWSWWWLQRGYVHVIGSDLRVDHDHSKDPVRDQYARSRREWTGFAMYLPLEPYGARQLLREWWTDQGSYSSIARARLSHRRAAKLLGRLTGTSRRAMLAQQRRAERVIAIPSPAVEVPDPPLRIAVMVDAFPVLSETFVKAEVLELQRLGHLVTVHAIAPADRPAPGVAAGLRTTYVTDESRLDKLAALAWLVGRHPLRCAADVLRRRAWRTDEDVAGLRALALRARSIDRDRVEHVHVHFALRSALDAMRIGRILELPYSVTAHAWDIYLQPRNLVAKLEAAAFATSGCDHTVSYLRSPASPWTAARIHKVVMGVDTEFFRRRAPLPNRRTVISVGRLVEKKGLLDLVDAIAGMPGAGVERVVVVGDGPQRQELQSRAAVLGVDGIIEWKGSLSSRQIRGLLEQADLLVLPCVIAANGDRDSMPVAIKEAMAMELMVVGTDTLGLPEMVDRRRGRLVPERSPAALGAAIAELLDLPASERAKMGAAARAWVLDHADIRVETQRLAELMAGAARGPRR